MTSPLARFDLQRKSATAAATAKAPSFDGAVGRFEGARKRGSALVNPPPEPVLLTLREVEDTAAVVKNTLTAHRMLLKSISDHETDGLFDQRQLGALAAQCRKTAALMTGGAALRRLLRGSNKDLLPLLDDYAALLKKTAQCVLDEEMDLAKARRQEKQLRTLNNKNLFCTRNTAGSWNVMGYGAILTALLVINWGNLQIPGTGTFLNLLDAGTAEITSSKSPKWLRDEVKRLFKVGDGEKPDSQAKAAVASVAAPVLARAALRASDWLKARYGLFEDIEDEIREIDADDAEAIYHFHGAMLEVLELLDESVKYSFVPQLKRELQKFYSRDVDGGHIQGREDDVLVRNNRKAGRLRHALKKTKNLATLMSQLPDYVRAVLPLEQYKALAREAAKQQSKYTSDGQRKVIRAKDVTESMAEVYQLMRELRPKEFKGVDDKDVMDVIHRDPALYRLYIEAIDNLAASKEVRPTTYQQRKPAEMRDEAMRLIKEKYPQYREYPTDLMYTWIAADEEVNREYNRILNNIKAVNEQVIKEAVELNYDIEELPAARYFDFNHLLKDFAEISEKNPFLKPIRKMRITHDEGLKLDGTSPLMSADGIMAIVGILRLQQQMATLRLGAQYVAALQRDIHSLALRGNGDGDEWKREWQPSLKDHLEYLHELPQAVVEDFGLANYEAAVKKKTAQQFELAFIQANEQNAFVDSDGAEHQPDEAVMKAVQAQLTKEEDQWL